MQEYKKLILDYDDVIRDTETSIRNVLKGKGFIIPDDMTAYSFICINEKAFDVVRNMLDTYEGIPYMVGAIEGIKILSQKYSISVCTAVTSTCERWFKYYDCKKLGLPVTMVGSTDPRGKAGVDMSDSIFVDDRTLVLNNTNSPRKICFYKKNNCHPFDGEIVLNWVELVDSLMA